MLFRSEASLVPLKVMVHSGQPKLKGKEILPLQEAQTQEEKDCIIAEDTAMVLGQWEMPTTSFCENEVITLDPCPIIYLEEEESNLSNELEVITLEPQEFAMSELFLYRTTSEHEGLLQPWFVGALSHEEGSQDIELQQAPSHFEDGVTLAAEQLVEINLGTYQELRPTFLGSGLQDWERQHIVDLLRSYKDCFA